MNIKKPLLIIISLLLLILLLFFICSDRRIFFKDDSSVRSVSDSGGIGYMREVSPGEERNDSDGESIPPGTVTDRADADTQERGSREVSVRKPSGVSVKKGNSGSVKPAAEKRILPEERKPVPEKSRVPDTGTASRKDESTAKEEQLIEKRSEIYAAAEKKDVSEETQSADKGEILKDIKDSDSTAADKKNETAAVKIEIVPDDKKEEISEVIPDKPVTGDVKYNRADRIHLYSGEVLTGAVTVRSDTYTIVTPEGIRKIDSKDIQGNDIVK